MEERLRTLVSKGKLYKVELITPLAFRKASRRQFLLQLQLQLELALLQLPGQRPLQLEQQPLQLEQQLLRRDYHQNLPI
jgi:hypothetical protein